MDSVPKLVIRGEILVCNVSQRNVTIVCQILSQRNHRKRGGGIRVWDGAFNGLTQRPPSYYRFNLDISKNTEEK